MTLRPDGKVLLTLRRPWSDGTSHLVFEPLELIEKLAALVPRPGANLVRYHGIFAPNAPWRREIVPQPEPKPEPAERDPAAPPPADPGSTGRGRWTLWADLLRRVFGFDALECTRCGGRMKPIAFITDPPVVEAILTALDLPTVPPPIAPAVAQLELFEA